MAIVEGTHGHDFDEDFFRSIFNVTLDGDSAGESFAPCSETAPEFKSLGLTVTFFIVFIFSFIGNAVVIYVVCCMDKCRASADTYLMHLALADLFFSLTLPFWAVYVHSGWIFGNVLCKVLSGLQEASVYSGVFLLACISVDRYVAIVKATRVLLSHQKLVKVVCGMVWLVAVVLCLPVAVQRETMQPDDLGDQIICYENITAESSDRWRVSVRVLRHTLGFFLPLAIMAFCYGRTLLTVLYMRNHQKRKAMRVILAVVIVFILCWLPHNVTVLIDTLMRGKSLGISSCNARNRVAVVLQLTRVLAFMHCAVNPVLYAFIGEKFRNELLLALYKHGIITKRLQMAYHKGSHSSSISIRSRNTSITL
ncbi:C-X-C chemokine receptor type 2 [Thalassophryne amazonica]|uniref:C-X-C chemokine receptor type 2 n=1 Tax=Thalassophryne amazonica TaxID=390379 RepID=UPI001471CD7B|nr:C-X-C chemokine receptor type 2 [Thalassophryne amazonica]